MIAKRIEVRLRRLWWRTRRRLSSSITLKTHQGRLTFSTRDEIISRQLYVYRGYEYEPSLRVMDFLRREGMLPPDGVRLYDIGANIGLIGIGLRLSGRVSQVVAVEPAPGNVTLLKRNVRQNGLEDCITAIGAALGAENGEVRLELSSSNLGDHRVRSASPKTERETYGESGREVIAIPALRLDDVVETIVRDAGPAPSFMWIDVQGYEGFVFRGGRKWLGSGVPVYSEVWPYGILRAGMTLDDFCEIVGSIWTHFYVERDREFVLRPIATLRTLLEELGPDRSTNVLFANLPEVGGDGDLTNAGAGHEPRKEVP